jgi:acyl-[acyl carrier protein]--UDP-N-acetylglucosamine O-acyltransferase
MIRVEGHKNLYRDEKSGAIVNCDTTSYNQYINSLNYKDMQRQELDKMKEDIDEIKTLLKEILNRK